jgi:hypothetical protein
MRLAVLCSFIVPLAFLAFLASGAVAQQDQPTLAARVSDVLERDADGHSPTPEEIAAISSLQPQPSADEVKTALPALLKAMSSPDVPVRTYALTLLTSLEATVTETAAQTDQPAASGPAAFQPAIAGTLASAIPQIASHLTDEVVANRTLAATVLGGFTPNPPATLYPPLLAYLKRDDAVGPVGLLVVGDLLTVGPVSEATASAIAQFLRRSDQTSDSRANLVDAISYKPYQNEILNKVLVSYLDSGNDSLRARVILSLPALDLSPETFQDARTRVQHLADSPGESLQVVNAAKAVAPCWTVVKMTSGCPVYP